MRLKAVAKSWQTLKIKQDKRELSLIQKELNDISADTTDVLTLEKKSKIRLLVNKKHSLLYKEEALWRLRSRALWLKAGDCNTKYFHNVANARRRRNLIWKIEDGDGAFLYSQEDITSEALRFFQAQYKRVPSNAEDMFWAAEHLPEMFDGTAYENFIRPVDEDELLAAMKASKKDRSPGPDGWPIEFFLHFFDLFKTDLLHMVEASRLSGNIHPALSSTLIALIPKKGDSASFLNYRPIALCNSLFKIISKIIAERIKPVLNCFITREQHAFLKDRNIWDAVALTQECLYKIRTRNTKAAILKIDLKKAYDCVDWGFLRILLAKIGMRSMGLEWIMACIENIKFSVIINSTPSSFFKAEQGLQQGCPLSPLMFILVMNTLSIQLNRAATCLRYRPIKMCKDFYLSHNLFVDDILIFAMLHKASWLHLFDIVSRFQSASGICINKDRSKLYHNENDQELVPWIAGLFGIEAVLIDNGLKYLGFSLSPTGNKMGDWLWLLNRFFTKISGWEARTLSLARRFTLIQSVLSQLAIYWAHIFFIPAPIINKMNSYAANFLWGGQSVQHKIHMVKMKYLMIPKKRGGWGLLDPRTMGNALLCKSLLRGIFGNGPWSIFIRSNYLKGKSIAFWYRRNALGIKRGSAIWKSFRKNFPFIQRHFRWSINTGSNIFIGTDLIHKGPPSPLPPSLVSFLHCRGIFSWDRLIKGWSSTSPIWKDAEDLMLPQYLCNVWNQVHSLLQGSAIKKSGAADVLVWSLPDASLPSRVKDIYSALSLKDVVSMMPMFPIRLWKASCPLKMILFSWLLFQNRNLSWDNLQKRGWNGSSRCTLCYSAGETNFHLFFQCQASKQVWYDLSLTLDYPYRCFSSVQDAFLWWNEQAESRRSFFIAVCWSIWIWRNESLFISWRPISSTLLRIKALLDFLGL